MDNWIEVCGSTMVLTEESKTRKEQGIRNLEKLIEYIQRNEVVSFECTYIMPDKHPAGGIAMDTLLFELCEHQNIKYQSIEDGRDIRQEPNDPDGEYGFAGLGTHDVDYGTRYRHVMKCQKCGREATHVDGMTPELARHVINGGKLKTKLVAAS